MRKRQCVPAHVQSLLKARDNPTEIFQEEIKSIIKGKNFEKSIISLQVKYKINDSKDVFPYIAFSIHSFYVQERVYDEKKYKVRSDFKTDLDYLRIIENTSRRVLSSINRSKMIKHYLECFIKQETPESRGYYRLKLVPLIKNFNTDGDEILKATEDMVVKATIYSFYKGRNFNLNELKDSLKVTHELLDEIEKVSKNWTLKSGEDTRLFAKIKEELVAFTAAGLFNTK
jgi:hypothetical protein